MDSESESIDCHVDSTILSLYHALVPTSRKSTIGPRTRAYLLEKESGIAHTRDGLRWTPVRLDETISDLLESRDEFPPLFFVSRASQHIVAIVGDKGNQADSGDTARNGFRASFSALVGRRGRPDSAVILGAKFKIHLYSVFA